jgi:hypothetical protein
MRFVATILSVVALFMATTVAEAGPPKGVTVAEWIQGLSVTVKAGNTSGCGTVITREKEGEQIHWIQTCAHVVEHCRNVKEIIDGRGNKRHVVTYDEVQIVQEIVKDGREVGRRQLDAKVFKCDRENDIAVLWLIATNELKGSVCFVKSDEAPAVGTELYHCGSPGGHDYGAHSVTPGIIAQAGRVLEDKEYDQITCASIGGSSGGAVINKETGEYLGILVSGLRSSDNFSYIVPMRRVRAWAKRARVEWLYDEKLPVPPLAELQKLPIEDDAAVFEGREAEGEPTLAPVPKVGDKPVLETKIGFGD